MVSSLPGSDTPITCRRAPAGLVSGPRKLKIVRTASSLRTGTTWRMARWKRGANMKPKPSSEMQAATASGPRSMRTPSASRTSAEPHWLVAERLPCLATGQPAPAAISAAVVETLKVGAPPPVPAVSTSSAPGASTFTASSRMVRARPAISATLSPLVRSANMNAAACASEARPSITSCSTAAASSAERSAPPATRSIALVMTGLGILGAEEVGEQRHPLLRQHRLRVELHPFGGQPRVAQAHDHVVRAGRHLELRRKVWIDHERVVATGHERCFEAPEDRPAVVLHGRGLAVHGLAP